MRWTLRNGGKFDIHKTENFYNINYFQIKYDIKYDKIKYSFHLKIK